MAVLDIFSTILENIMNVVVDGTTQSLKDMKRAFWRTLVEVFFVGTAVAAILVGTVLLMLIYLPLEVFALLSIIGGLLVLVFSLLVMAFK